MRSRLLKFKKDGRSCRATIYNTVLRRFLDVIQKFGSLLEGYESHLKNVFENPEHTMSVKQIGDAHYLFRESALDRYGFGNPMQRKRKLEEIHTNVSQLKAMLVGLEFLVLSPENCAR